MVYEFSDVQLDVAFTKASSKAELTNLDNIATIVGKIAKWYDLYAWSAWTAPTVEVTGSGNAVTSASYGTGDNANKLTLTLGGTFLTQHPVIPVTTDTTSTDSPAFGSTFTAVDSVSRDANGHVTTLNTKTITLPDTATTQAKTDNSTKIATTAFVKSVAGDYIPLAGSTAISGNLKFNTSTRGIWLKDKANNVYGALYDNGNNFWIGAADSDSLSHVGKTFISSGYDDTTSKPYLAPYVAIPNATNTKTNTTYSIYHSGNVSGGSGITISSAAATNYSGYNFSIGHTNSVAAVTTVSLLKFTYDAQGHITGSTAVAAEDLPTKYAFVVDETSDFASYAWHKFAEVTIDTVTTDATATFLVSKTWGNTPLVTGILSAHIRTGGTKVFESAQFRWIITNGEGGINPNEFVMVYTNTASTSCKVELWHKQTSRYDGWVFKLLKEHSRAAYGACPWTLFKHNGHGSATYTTGTGEIVSTLNSIANPALSANKINTDAGNSNTPVYFSNGVPVAVNTAASGANFNIVPQVRNGDGVMEIGRYIDFHSTAAGTTDYDIRFDASSTSLLTMTCNAGTPQFRISGTLPRLSFKQTTSGSAYESANCGITAYPANTSGVNLVIQSAGNMFIGGGESVTAMYTAVKTSGANPYTNLKRSVDSGGTASSITPAIGNEKMFITSDEQIFFAVGANGLSTSAYTDWTHLKTVLLDSDGFFRPSVNNKGQIGTSDYKWKAVHATEVVGNAVGKDGFVSYPEDGTFSGNDMSSEMSRIIITLPIDLSTLTSSNYFKVGFKVDIWAYGPSPETSDTLTIAGLIAIDDSTLAWPSVTALSNNYSFEVSFGFLNSKALIGIIVPDLYPHPQLYTPEIRIRDIVVCDGSGNHNTFAENKSGWIIGHSTDFATGYEESAYIPNSSLISQIGCIWNPMTYSKAIINTSGALIAGKSVGFFSTWDATIQKYELSLDATTNTVSAYAYNGDYTIFNIKSKDYARLSFQTTKSSKTCTAPGIIMYPLTTSGMTALFSCGGNMVIGGGEFATNAYARKDSSNVTKVGYDNIVTTENEKLYLGADSEVQIISNAGSIATYNNNNHKVWKFQTDGKLITPGAIADTLSAQHQMLQQNVRSDSNAVTLIEWIVNGAASTTYRPGITFHNTGGDSTDKGAIILRPYHHNNAPWGTDVGLYIGKGILKLDGTNVSLEGHTHETLTCKSVDATTVNNTAGCFFFKGVNLIGGVNDWVGIQADAGNDKFQLMPNGGGSLMYRQNDTGGTNSSNWSTWNGILTASSVTTDSYLSVAATTTTVGSGTTAFTYNSGVKISHKAYTSKTSGLYKITVDAAGHVSATASVAKGDIPALDYVPNTTAGVSTALNLLSTGNSVPVDNDYYISQYVNGGTSTTTYHRRPVSALYSYIYGKLQHDNAMNTSHTFAAWNSVGWHRVLSLPCSSSASGKMIRTLELTAARTFNNAQPEIFSVRLIGLYNTAEGFEILYSKSNNASTQLMTKVRMTKSSDGKTLYVDIYYNSTSSNTLTVFCALIDPANNTDGFSSSTITWGNGAVVDNSLTVVASLDIPRDITAPGTGFYYVIGTQTASTAAWTGTIPASKLHNGLTIAYYLPYASAASTNVTLNLTLSTGATTGAINCYWNGTTRLTTHYPAGSTIILTYFEAGAISVGGTATTDARWTHSDYNTNTNTYVTQSSSTTANYRALMLGYNNSSTPSDLTATVTNQVYDSANLYAQPSTGLIGCNGRKLITPFAIQTGSSKRQKITLQTLMTWLITTKTYIHSGIYEHVVLQTTWAYADNDILRLAVNGINYEMDLAGVRIEYIGSATSYNAGAFTLKIISNPAPNFTATSGYTKFPPSTIAFYTCNGSSYVWRMIMNGACGQPKIFESTDNLSVLPMPIEVTGLFTNWKVLLAQCTRLIYGGGDECSSFQVIIPLEYLKSLGTSGEMHIPLPFTIENNPIGRNYMKLKYVNDNKFTIGYYNDGIDTIGGRGLWTLYGMY